MLHFHKELLGKKTSFRRRVGMWTVITFIIKPAGTFNSWCSSVLFWNYKLGRLGRGKDKFYLIREVTVLLNSMLWVSMIEFKSDQLIPRETLLVNGDGPKSRQLRCSTHINEYHRCHDLSFFLLESIWILSRPQSPLLGLLTKWRYSVDLISLSFSFSCKIDR